MLYTSGPSPSILQTFNLNRPARSPALYLSLDESKVLSGLTFAKKSTVKFSTSFTLFYTKDIHMVIHRFIHKKCGLVPEMDKKA